jgi:hypothetical protein
LKQHHKNKIKNKKMASLTSPRKKQCMYFAKSGSCRNGDQCPFSHASEVDSLAAESDLPRNHLEQEMLARKVNIYAVDERTQPTKQKKYLVATSGVVRYDESVTATYAYGKIRASLNKNCAIGIDLEGTSDLQVRV